MKRIFSLFLIIIMVLSFCFIASADYRDPVDGIKMKTGLNPVVMNVDKTHIQYAVYAVGMENMTNGDFIITYPDNMALESFEEIDSFSMLSYHDTGSQVNVSFVYEQNCGKSAIKLFVLTFEYTGETEYPVLKISHIAGTFIQKIADVVTVDYDGKNDLSEQPSLGDVDLNGKITAADARLALRFSAKLESLSEKQQKNADVNADKQINASDARKILRYSANLESSF